MVGKPPFEVARLQFPCKVIVGRWVNSPVDLNNSRGTVYFSAFLSCPLELEWPFIERQLALLCEDQSEKGTYRKIKMGNPQFPPTMTRERQRKLGVFLLVSLCFVFSL